MCYELLTESEVGLSAAINWQQDDPAVDVVLAGDHVMGDQHREVVHVVLRVDAATWRRQTEFAEDGAW